MFFQQGSLDAVGLSGGLQGAVGIGVSQDAVDEGGQVAALAAADAVQLLRDSLPRAGFGWLLAGGIIYTIGGIIYGLKLPLFNSRHRNFGSHEIFHVFVMLGSACHFILMAGYFSACYSTFRIPSGLIFVFL